MQNVKFIKYTFYQSVIIMRKFDIMFKIRKNHILINCKNRKNRL